MPNDDLGASMWLEAFAVAITAHRGLALAAGASDEQCERACSMIEAFLDALPLRKSGKP
jgi:hypothetical protein